MIKASNFERALHQWEPWLRSVKDARLQSYPDSDKWWAYAKATMRKLHLPSKSLLCLYFLSCVFSQYERHGVYYYQNIQLPSVLFEKWDSFNNRIAPAIWRFLYVFDFLRTRPISLCPDLMAMRDRLLPPAVWNEGDVKLALQWESHHRNFTYVGEPEIITEDNNPFRQLREYYSPFFVVLAPEHPILRIASNIKRKMDDKLAIRCAEMKDIEHYTYVKIGKEFGWPLQENEYGKPNRCYKARRYVRRGRDLLSEKGDV